MKTYKDLATEKNSTLDILDNIQEVKVSPFFKNQVLQNIKSQQEEITDSSGWFNTSLQLATIALVVLLNTFTIYYYVNSKGDFHQVTDIESFAKEYHLTTENSVVLN